MGQQNIQVSRFVGSMNMGAEAKNTHIHKRFTNSTVRPTKVSINITHIYIYIIYIYILLVVSNILVKFSMIYGIILPID